MLPVANRGAGMFIAEPDVCLTPVGLVVVPIPYVNVAFNMMAVSFAPNVLTTALPTLNMGSIIPMSFGDEPGVAHWSIKGMATVVVGNPIVYVLALPAVNLLCPTTGNNFNAPVGLVAVPSATNVLLTYAGPEEARPSAGVAMSAREVRDFIEPLEAPGDLVRGELLEGGVGYIEVRAFSSAAPPAIYAAVQSLRGQGMTALILDLRGNPGGELRAMAEVAGDFLEPGSVIASVTDGDGDETALRAQGPCLYSFPLALLVDGGTASAAELFAGSLQWHGRALIVGEPTRGKGSAQVLFPSPDGGAHYATAAICALPGGEPVDGAGVRPDIERRGVPRPPPAGFFEKAWAERSPRGVSASSS